MRVALVGTYPPTRCGIATFTADIESILLDQGVEVIVVPVAPETGDGPCLVRDDPSSYAFAARQVDSLGADVVLIQHEFGIFGGDDGEHLLRFTDRLSTRFVVTLHTVLAHPTPTQERVLHALCERACGLTVFTPSAKRMLVEQELATADRISVVPHPAPAALGAPVDTDAVRRWLFLPPDAPVMVSFGLLSEGKGIELALRAMRRLEDRLPDLHYVVAGRTHPEVQRRDGERYRRSLVELALELDIGERLRFVNEFLPVDALAGLLAASDLVCTPYRGEEQSVSGVLTYALAAARPVVSTPYRYATEMLSDGAGRLAPFDDPSALADQIAALLEGPQAQLARAAATRASRQMQWDSVGAGLVDVLGRAVAGSNRSQLPAARDTSRPHGVKGRHPAKGSATPSPHSSVAPARHLRVLCDDTAILQHAEGRVPRAEDGYCVDDAGRVVALAAWLHRTSGDDDWERVSMRMLTFLRSAHHDDGGAEADVAGMRNFMSWDRRWLDAPHTGDHVGRAVWGLGETVAWSNDDGTIRAAGTLLDRSLRSVGPASTVRTLAYAALGVTAAVPSLPHLRTSVSRLARIMGRWRPGERWPWFEHRLSYDNARICEAMLRVGSAAGDDQLVDDGLEQLRWLEALSWRGGHYRVVGHRGLSPGERVEDSGDEQPLDVSGLADAALVAHQLTGDAMFLEVVERAWSWFLGNNRLGEAVFDLSTGAGADGLCAHGVNRNCGAESTISGVRCWIAVQAARSAVAERAEHVNGTAHVHP